MLMPVGGNLGINGEEFSFRLATFFIISLYFTSLDKRDLGLQGPNSLVTNEPNIHVFGLWEEVNSILLVVRQPQSRHAALSV